MRRALVALAGVAGAVVVAAPVAHAIPGPWDDPSLTPAAQNYVNHMHRVICSELDAQPTPDGVLGILNGITVTGFSQRDANRIVNVSVAKTCPGYMPLLTRVGDRQRAHSAAVHVPIPAHWRWRGAMILV